MRVPLILCIEKVKKSEFYIYPIYYESKGIEARKVIEDFNLSYYVGTAVTYLLRAERKHESPYECIKKAINHLEFELEKINYNEQ